MRNFLIALLAVICLTTVNSQDINGTWTFDWQNNANLALCVPQSFIIYMDTVTPNQINVNYTYSAPTLNSNCPADINTKFADILTKNTGNYSDTYGRTITVNGSALYFTPNATAPATFYQLHNTAIQPQPTIGALGSLWGGPAVVAGNCCAPATIGLFPSSQVPNTFVYSATYTTCAGANVTNVPLTLFGSNATTISYVDSTTAPTVNILYTPAATVASESTITVALTPNTCIYTYQRVNPAGPILANTWVQDWQSNNSNVFSSQYTIAAANTPANLTYMTSLFTRAANNVSGYVLQTGNTLYTDSALNQTFTYDNNTQSLLSGNFLYSLTGAVLSPAPFVALWGAPVTAAGVNTSACCIPAFLSITSNPTNNNTLNAAYTLPEGYTANSGCEGFADKIQTNGVMDTILAIQQPSFTELTWVDELNIAVTFNSSAATPTIIATIPGQCQVSMTVSTPPPPPGPLSGSWISTKVMGLVMGLFMVLACL